MEKDGHQLTEEERIQTLEGLVDELLKDNPEENFIKDCMEKTGIPYTKDPIERINYVLKALHFKEPQNKEKN